MAESTATLARTATERSADIWKQGALGVSEQAAAFSRWPIGDLSQAFERYYEYIQRGVQVNREYAKSWVEVTTTVLDAFRSHTSALGDAARGHGEAVETWIRGEAEVVEKSAQEQAEALEQAERDRARRARQTEREEARREHARAREPYEGLTKSELADRLAERELPRTGTVEELIERLVQADSA